MPALPYASSLAACTQRLRDTPWTATMRYAWATLLACAFLGIALPAARKHALHRLFLVAPLLPFVAKDLAHLPDALARTRAALASRDWRALPLSWVHPECLGLLRLDRALRRGCLNWLLRRPQPAPPLGQPFGYLERGAYGTVVAIVLVAALVDLPLNAFIVQLFARTAQQRELIHLLALLAGLSSLVWVLGDRWLVGKGQHVLDDDAFHVRVGARTTGIIPRHAIARCEQVPTGVDEWCRQRRIDPRRTLRASPLDKPNAVLILEPDSCVRLTHLGVERTGLACVFLYLDSPHALAAALAEA